MFKTIRLPLVAMALIAVGCQSPQPAAKDIAKTERPAAAPRATTQPAGVADRRLPKYQTELIQLAYDFAAAMPIHPHVKDRSKHQEAVAGVCFELDQPQRGLGYVKEIANWRRAAGLADYAACRARLGDREGLQPYLDEALEIQHTIEDWQAASVKTKVAQAHAWAGQYDRINPLQGELNPLETGRVAVVLAERCDEQMYEVLVKDLERFSSSLNFETVRNAADAYCVIYRRFYRDGAKRDAAESRIRATWKILPTMSKLDVLAELIRGTIKNHDKIKAMALVSEMQAEVDGVEWDLESGIPIRARLAELRYLAGDRKGGRAAADAELAFYGERGRYLQNFERADVLIPLAKAYQVIGDSATSLTIYERATNEAVENPNSRPRAEDLSAVCRSMALQGVKPDGEFLARLRQIYDGLGSPW